MSRYEAADLLRHIEHHADGHSAHVAVLDLWKAIEGNGWTTSAFVDGLNQLVVLGYIQLIGDRVVLKEPAVAQPLHRRQ